MKKINSIRIIFLAIALCGVFLVISSAASKAPQKEQESVEQCSKNHDMGDKMIPDNLSHQFFSSL